MNKLSTLASFKIETAPEIQFKRKAIRIRLSGRVRWGSLSPDIWQKMKKLRGQLTKIKSEIS
jgi:hypothetical protein